MNKNAMTIGIVIGSIVTILPSASAQSVFADRLLLTQQQDSQGCIYQERGGYRSKICYKPQFNGMRIDDCHASKCNIQMAADKFCGYAIAYYAAVFDSGLPIVNKESKANFQAAQNKAKDVANQLQTKYPNLNINSYHKDIAWELANRQARGEGVQESINNAINAISGKISNER